MTPSRSTEGLLNSTKRRKAESRAKIRKALREMKKKGLAININAVATYANVARKTIYNHPDLRDEIRAAASAASPQLANLEAGPTTESSIAAALQGQLRAQKRSYDNDVAALKAEVANLKQDLAVAHGEIHRLRHSAPAAASADSNRPMSPPALRTETSRRLPGGQ